VLAESLSRDLKPQVVGFTKEGEPVIASVPIKGASLTAYLRGMSSLLVTEGDRRRIQLELELVKRPPPATGATPVRLLDEYRNRRAG
jgi:hypothetical protein